MQSALRQRFVDVERGLFLVRYVTADDVALPPEVRLTPEPNGADDIRFVLHPDEDEAVLRHPGTSLVMLAEGSGRLVVDIAPSQEEGSIGAKIAIEPLAQGGALYNFKGRAPRRGPLDLSSFELLGHVASLGDVSVKAGQWLAGPTAPSRIEGFRLAWRNKPDNLDIRYSAKTGRPQAQSGQLSGLGGFVGSRGKALPIVGADFQLSGSAAFNYRLSAEMIFLGSPAMRMVGPQVSGSGPTGREPMVGLRIAVEEIGAEQRRGTTPAVASPHLAPGVRVYRSGQSERQARV